MSTNHSPVLSGRRTAWIALFLLALIGAAVVITQVWIIQPFRPQSERDVALSYALKIWSPLITLAVSGVALILIVWLWRDTRRWWLKAALIIILLPFLAATWFANQNHFEWMFSPVANASYVKPGEASFLIDADVVMSVETNGEAVAYPIRVMAYHHVVQDVVGGTPVVATY
jgi:hypothetical protein